jgi:hypothetical protein
MAREKPSENIPGHAFRSFNEFRQQAGFLGSIAFRAQYAPPAVFGSTALVTGVAAMFFQVSVMGPLWPQAGFLVASVMTGASIILQWQIYIWGFIRLLSWRNNRLLSWLKGLTIALVAVTILMPVAVYCFAEPFFDVGFTKEASEQAGTKASTTVQEVLVERGGDPHAVWRGWFLMLNRLGLVFVFLAWSVLTHAQFTFFVAWVRKKDQGKRDYAARKTRSKLGLQPGSTNP